MSISSPPSPEALEGLYRRHHRLENLYPDPLVFARGYGDPADGEVAGLLAAALAYGRVEKIVETLEGVFERVGPEPRAMVMGRKPHEWVEAFDGFVYRFHKGPDLALFCHLLAQTLDRWGGLAAPFEAAGGAHDTRAGLVGLAQAVLAEDARPLLPRRGVPARHPVRHLLASPASGGAAKRLCLYLRWMVRRDELDPGYWHGRFDPARLVVPLDTHVARVGRNLGLTGRKSADWKTAVEITNALCRYDPADPVRYDFSLFRYGRGVKGEG